MRHSARLARRNRAPHGNAQRRQARAFGRDLIGAGTEGLLKAIESLGTETFEVIASSDDSLEPGCTYPMDSVGTIVSGS